MASMNIISTWRYTYRNGLIGQMEQCEHFIERQGVMAEDFRVTIFEPDGTTPVTARQPQIQFAPVRESAVVMADQWAGESSALADWTLIRP